MLKKNAKSIRCFQMKNNEKSRFHQNCMFFELAGKAGLDLDLKLEVPLTVLADMKHAIPLDKMQ